MSIEFHLRQHLTPYGWLSDPIIPVSVRTLTGYVPFGFLIDTGADFCLAPRRLADRTGLDWNTLVPAELIGVEQQGIHARMGTLSVRIADTDLDVRCLFHDGPNTPYILGRADFLDRFVLTIDQGQQRITLDPIT